MQDSTFYAGIPVGNQQRRSNTLRSQLVLLALPIFILAISVGSLYGLQLASQRGIMLGYPMPQVQITTTYSSPVRLNDSVQFSAEASGRDLTYQWNFGDQTGATGSSVNHTFQSAGNFTVTVTVTDAGNRTSSAAISVTVMPPPPTVSFTYSTSSFYYVSFDASGSSADPSTSITNYQWDFGDGNTDSTSSSSEYHYYSSSGTYTVVLIVTDGTGQQSQPYSLQITV
jgi:PKD repeat protein